jgi:uncharacterized membrane protein
VLVGAIRLYAYWAGTHFVGPQKPLSQAGSAVVERNISTLLARRRSEDESLGLQGRVAHTVTTFIGSMHFVYAHLVGFGAWIAVNGGYTPLHPFDPTLALLGVLASVEAIFLTTFVLIGQNRMARIEAKRAELNLQITLLSEHEITRLLTVVRAIAARLDIAESRDPEIAELARDLPAEHVLDTIDKKTRE